MSFSSRNQVQPTLTGFWDRGIDPIWAWHADDWLPQRLEPTEELHHHTKSQPLSDLSQSPDYLIITALLQEVLRDAEQLIDGCHRLQVVVSDHGFSSMVPWHLHQPLRHGHDIVVTYCVPIRATGYAEFEYLELKPDFDRHDLVEMRNRCADRPSSRLVCPTKSVLRLRFNASSLAHRVVHHPGCSHLWFTFLGCQLRNKQLQRSLQTTPGLYHDLLPAFI